MRWFTYGSPLGLWGYLFVMAGVLIFFGSLWLFVRAVQEAPTDGFAILTAMILPLLGLLFSMGLIVVGSGGLFVTLLGPTSMDDYGGVVGDAGRDDDRIWGRCPQCGYRNAWRATICARCASDL